MAKTIKFNLICDGNPVRTIEDLQNNFSIEDVLAYYNNKLLHRWLNVRGYEKELEAVNEINDDEPICVIKKLISIFGIEIDEKDIEEGIYILDYLDERKELYDIYEQQDYKVKSIIDDYQTGYQQLINAIIENNSDIVKIKTSINEIMEQYPWVFEMNHCKVFDTFCCHAPLAIFALLTNEKARKYFLPVATKKNVDPNESTSEKTSRLFSTVPTIKSISLTAYGTITSTSTSANEQNYDTDSAENTAKKRMYDRICRMTSENNLGKILKDNLKRFSGKTNGYWKDIEEKGKKYMILHMDSGDYVRSAGEKDGDLGFQDIINRFVILNGIDYKSNDVIHELLYMEV